MFPPHTQHVGVKPPAAQLQLCKQSVTKVDFVTLLIQYTQKLVSNFVLCVIITLLKVCLGLVLLTPTPGEGASHYAKTGRFSAKLASKAASNRL